MADFILCTLGTRGDIKPLALLSARLIAKGHQVEICTNANWRGLVEGSGARFIEIADPDPPQNGRDDFQFYLSNSLPSFRRSFEHVEQRVRSGAKPVLVYRTNMLGAECAAERFQLRNARVVLQPSAIRSFHRPAWPMTKLVSGPLGWIGRKLLVPLVVIIGERLSPYRAPTAAFRRSVGLPGRRPSPSVEDLTLLLCPKWFAFPSRTGRRLASLSAFLTHLQGRWMRSQGSFWSATPVPWCSRPGPAWAGSKAPRAA